MRQTFLLLSIGLAALCAASAQPSIGGIVNAASYAVAAQGNNNLAQGSIFVIFGKNMGPANLVLNTGLPLPTSLPDSNGTSVTVASGGQNFNAYLVYTSAGQIAGILPSNVPVGPATVTVKYNGQSSAAAPINVLKASFGVFTANQAGSGPAISLVFKSSTDFAFNGLTTGVCRFGNCYPAHPGDTVVIVGTGLGPVSVGDNVAPGAVATSSNVTVTLGGKTIQPLYAGRSPQFPGEDQINLQLPADVALGCYTPAVVTVDGVPSNDFVLSTAAAGATSCTHPLGLAPDALANLDAGKTANIAVFNLLRAEVSKVPVEGAGGLFDMVDANGAFQLFKLVLVNFGALSPIQVAPGSCAVVDQFQNAAAFSVPNFSLLGGKELVAGPALNLSGTNGNSQVIPRQDTGGYLFPFFNTLGAGSWTLTGPGGADVGAFTAKADLPENLIWQNLGNFSNVPRNDITITWSGGNLNAQSTVLISGNSSVTNTKNPSQNRGKTFYCVVPASAGRFVVPASVLMQLPASVDDAANGISSSGTLGVTSGNLSMFSAPLTAGGKLDAGILAYGEAQTISVKYQQ